MAVTRQDYTQTGSTTTYVVPFVVIEAADIDVYIEGTLQLQQNTTSTANTTHPQVISGEITQGTALTNYTVASNNGTITFNAAPTAGHFIVIERTTNDASAATFVSGSTIRAKDLNDSFDQTRFIAQEAVFTANQNVIESRERANAYTAKDRKIENLANADRDDGAVNRGQLGKVITDDLIAGDSITLTDSTGGTNSNKQVTVSIADNTLDLDKIKSEDIVLTSDYSSTWTGEDDKIATVGALEARHDVVVADSASPPETTQIGKQWLRTTPGLQEFKVYDGEGWRTVATGTPYSPNTATIVRYVDATNGSDASSVTGFLPNTPLRSIKRAVDLINTDGSDGSLVVVAPGVYQETLPIQIQRNNVSIVGQALRSCFVQPTQATETNTMFECNSGTLLANMTFVGLKASGTRGNSAYDSDATYGLPENQGWACAFYAGATIKKSPYIQNCTNFADSSIDNSIEYDQTSLPAGGIGGDTSSAMTGGGILCDGSVPASNSPLRSFVVDSFTQIALDGPGILCTNGGYSQLVSFFGTFCHYHAKALNGGQLNLSNCTTDFGRYGLISDGRSTSAQITGLSVGTTNAAATTIVVDGLTAQNDFFSNQPGTTMIMEVGGASYQILNATQVSANQCTVNIYRATNSTPHTNLGFAAQINDDTAVSFKLRSYISTGGHTFEYVGSGTDYSAHPDYGGQAVEANQVIELGGTGSADDQLYNSGKVWQSSTDENGLFKVGTKFKVDQRRGTITVDGLNISAEVLSDSTPQLGGDLDCNLNTILGLPTAPTATDEATSKTYVDTTISSSISTLTTNTINPISTSVSTKSDTATTTTKTSATGSSNIPVGTTAQRDTTPVEGMFRYNTSTLSFEGYSNGAWSPVGITPTKNFIINGSCQVAQRDFDKAVGVLTVAGYGDDPYQAVDRFAFAWDGPYGTTRNQTYTFDRTTLSSNDPPYEKGLRHAFAFARNSFTQSLAQADAVSIEYWIEKRDLHELKYGTSDAKTLTLSFWIKGLAGTHAITFTSPQRNITPDRVCTHTYTINATNTWEYKTITFAGDTVKELDNNANERGLGIRWYVNVGSDYTSGTASTTFQDDVQANRAAGHTMASNAYITYAAGIQLTGVQLEVGTLATPFVHKRYSDELRDCQRYFLFHKTVYSGRYSTSGAMAHVYFPVTMRETPSTFSFTTSGISSGTSVTSIYENDQYVRSYYSGDTSYAMSNIRIDTEL